MKIKQNTHWMVILAILSAFTGCIHDQNEPSPPSKGNSLTINFTLPASEVRTRSIPAQLGENNINDLTLLFFDYTTNGTGNFVAFHQVEKEDIPTEGEMWGDLNNLFDLEIILESTLGLSLSNAYNILVFANLSDGTYFNDIYDDAEFNEFIGNISQMNENDVRRTMIMKVTGVGATVEAQYINDQAMKINNLPMSAIATKTANSSNVDCKLIRTVVRYDVINKATNYTLVSASIWNAFPRGNVFDYSNVDYTYSRLKRYYGMRNETEGYEEIHGGLYSFENVNTNPTQKDEKTTCLILGLINDNLPAEGISYYRVNISPKVTGQYLTRNNVYQVTISAVNGKGAPSEPDAYNSEKVLIDTSINSWDRDEDGLVVRDETHMMALPTKRAYFGPEAEERQYFIYTMGEGTLTMSTLSMPEGIRTTLIGNDLYITVDPFSGDKRTGAVRFNFAGLTAVMEIIQSGQASKTLRLSHTQVGSWPAGTQWIDRMQENPIEIESSGPWTAEIYNGFFSFANGSTQILLNGDNRDKIENVYNTSINATAPMRHSFILVTLDEDPENYRNVVVLTQLGSGNFTISPNSPLGFNADGTLSTATNTYTVYPGANTDTWTAQITGKNADAFAITLNGTIEGGKVKGQGSFTVTALGENFGVELEASVTVVHNEINQQTIPIFQDAYTFSLSHTAIAMGSKGGETVPVTVRCNKPTATWSAVIESNVPSSLTNMQPFIVNSNGERVTTISNQPVETTFKVWMPPVVTKLNQNPQAIVRVTLDNGKVATLTVTQEEVKYVPLYAQTFRPDLAGNWSSNLHYGTFGKWADEMRNSGNFGPGGTVYTQSPIDVSKSGWEQLYTDPDGVRPRILNMNNTMYIPAVTNIITSVKNDENTVFIIYEWSTSQNTFRNFGLGGVYTPAGPTTIPRSTPRKLNTDPSVRSTELWNYIFEEGPFGKVNPENVVLYPQDYPNFMAYLTKWPSTFIPLMFAPDTSGQPNTGRALLGVDPTNRIIWLGHKDMFGTDTGSSYTNWGNSDNLKFLKNLIAWMVHVNNYGDAFNDRFKIP